MDKMRDPVDLQKVERNARHRFSEDGLLYLFIGLLLAMVGLSFFDARFSMFGGLAALLFFPLKALRERITYPRIGYVEFKVAEGTGRGILGFAVVAVAFLTLVAFVGGGRFQAFMPLAISIIFGLSMYFGASVNGIRLRDWVIMAITLAGGLATALWIDNWRMATAVLMWLTAVLLILMGTIDLIRFMRKYPLQEFNDVYQGK
jgi:hypothetical protein